MTQPVLSFRTESITHPGKVRKINEDSLFARAKHGIWLVADGMGGHRDGNVASSMIAEAAGRLNAGKNLIPDFVACIKDVNQRLIAMSGGVHERIVGSTVNALIIQGSHYTCLWAGDSRCYLIRGGRIEQQSRDHTEAEELLSAGAITAEEASVWPRRNVITRAVGADQEIELASREGEVQAGDLFLLCSDGLTGHVSDAEILSFSGDRSPHLLCEALLGLALERGGKDNISIIALQVVEHDKTRVLDNPWMAVKNTADE
jgi:serine/threonine protein phosphatase PrpC